MDWVRNLSRCVWIGISFVVRLDRHIFCEKDEMKRTYCLLVAVWSCATTSHMAIAGSVLVATGSYQ